MSLVQALPLGAPSTTQALTVMGEVVDYSSSRTTWPRTAGPSYRLMSPSLEDTLQRLKYILSQRGVAPHDMDDIIQDAFQRLEQYRKTQDVAHVEGFLVRTAINLAIDRIRQQRRARTVSEPLENLLIPDEAPLPDEVYAARERIERLNKGFAALDPTTRQMLRAQRVEGLSVAAIARRYGVSVSAVEKRLAKGIQFLVNWMNGW